MEVLNAFRGGKSHVVILFIFISRGASRRETETGPGSSSARSFGASSASRPSQPTRTPRKGPQHVIRSKFAKLTSVADLRNPPRLLIFPQLTLCSTDRKS